MLWLKVQEREYFDERTHEFVTIPGRTLQLEHSLVSVAKWEAKTHKPFLTETEKTYDETIEYIKCMTITQNVDPRVYNNLRNEDIERVNKYMADTMTATWFAEDPAEPYKPKRKKVVTAELIYYWMIAYNIPVDYQRWHLNRLLTLIRVCEAEQRPPKKMSRHARNSQNRALNAARRKRLGTSG